MRLSSSLVRETFEVNLMTTARDLLVGVERLKNLLVLRATGRDSDDAEYVKQRRELLSDSRIRTKLPSFVESCRDLEEFWTYIKPRFVTYAERRSFLQERFLPVLSMLETDAGILAPIAEDAKAAGGETATYDVAVSYASEDLAVAQNLAKEMEAAGIRAFFDRFSQAELWGKDLAEWFKEVYGARTEYVLVLISEHYAVKNWTDFEFTIAREEARLRKEEFILPVRLDDTPYVGLKSSIAYLDLKRIGVDGVVAAVLEKLNREGRVQGRAPQSPPSKDRNEAFARLVFFFRRHEARIERFAISWVNPETLHQVEVNAEIQYMGKGELESVLVKLVVDNRLTTGPSSHSLSFRDLNVLVDGRSVPVKFAQFPWKGHEGVPLFKSVPQRLFGTDMPIFFKKEWVEDENPPFLYWELHAPDREPSRGFVLVKRDGEDIILVSTSVPAIGAFQQNGRSRSFLTDPDLSFGP